jgi:hypothetical protein
MTGSRTTLPVSAAHIATVRDVLDHACWLPGTPNPHAALDALAARIDTLETERDEARRQLAFFTDGKQTITVGRKFLADLEAACLDAELRNERLTERRRTLTRSLRVWRDMAKEAQEKANGWRACAEDAGGNLFCARAEAAEAKIETLRAILRDAQFFITNVPQDDGNDPTGEGREIASGILASIAALAAADTADTDTT